MSEQSAKQWVAVVGIVVRERAILAMRRSHAKDVGAGLWETISGRVEPGEHPVAAIGREVFEETGMEVDIWPRPVESYSAMRGEAPMVVIVYRADWIRGEVRRSEEHDDHRWVSPDEFAALTTLDRLALAVRRAVALPPPAS